MNLYLKYISILFIFICLFTACKNKQNQAISDTLFNSSALQTNSVISSQTSPAPANTPIPTVIPTPIDITTPAPSTVEAKNAFTKADFSRVDGSTATIPLSEAIAVEFLKIKPEQASQVIQHYTTHEAYMRLISSTVDFILVTEPSVEELKAAKDKGLELEVVPVVKDAFVFLVNTKNPIQSLTLKQIQDMYSGKITNWKDVGGKSGEILAYQRPVNSGSQTLMENMVMKGLKLKEAPKEMMPSAMGELIEMVAGYKDAENAIGYSVYYYANSMYTRDTIKLIEVDGIKPEKSTIQPGKYPLTSAYYAVIRKSEPADSLARRMLTWILSPDGQNIAEEAGYIPVR